jgi:hypothetical protein
MGVRKTSGRSLRDGGDSAHKVASEMLGANNFDEAVRSMRGKLPPKKCSKRKDAATPEEWAAHLDYAMARSALPAEKEKRKARLNRWRSRSDVRERIRVKHRGYCAKRRSTPETAERIKRLRMEPAQRARRIERQREYSKSDAGRALHNSYKNSYNKRRSKTDVQFKLAMRLRKRMNMAVRKCSKSGSAVADLGCSMTEFREYIESMFHSGMSWDNWGTVWALDHLYPLAMADLSDRSQFLAVCHWSNYTPLLISQNARKGSSVTKESRTLFEKLRLQFAQLLPKPPEK